jgi:hypothetical protein
MSFPLPGPTTGTPLHLIVHVPQPNPAHFSCGLHRRAGGTQITPGTLLPGLISTTPFVTLKLQVSSASALSAAVAATHSEKPLNSGLECLASGNVQNNDLFLSSTESAFSLSSN